MIYNKAVLDTHKNSNRCVVGNKERCSARMNLIQLSNNIIGSLDLGTSRARSGLTVLCCLWAGNVLATQAKSQATFDCPSGGGFIPWIKVQMAKHLSKVPQQHLDSLNVQVTCNRPLLCFEKNSSRVIPGFASPRALPTKCTPCELSLETNRTHLIDHLMVTARALFDVRKPCEFVADKLI